MGGRCESADASDELILEVALPFGNRDTTFHLLALSICNALASIAIAISIWHILMHTLHYLRPYEQKHIIRILAVIPIYAWTTFLAYVFYNNAIYYELIRDCYAAYAVASFFTLACHYIAPNIHEQKQYFRNVEPKNWGWPLNWLQKLTGGKHKGWLRKPISGVTWFNICYVGIFQYCVIRTLVTVVAVMTQSFGQFCQGGSNPRYASLWTAIIDAISVFVAMYCLDQFYLQLKEDLRPNRPILKMLSIKLIVFLTFWQTWLISILIHFGALKPTKYVAGQDLRIGIPSLLTCAETVIFALIHRWAFPWSSYDINRLPKFPEQMCEGDAVDAVLDAMNPWDYFKAFARGFRWLFHGIRARKEDPSYKNEEEGNDKELEIRRGRGGTETDPFHIEVKGKVQEDRKTI